MRRLPVVKTEIVQSFVIPAKRKGIVLYSLMLLVIGAVIGAVCVLAVLAGPLLPTSSGRAPQQPDLVGESQIVVSDLPTSNYSFERVNTNQALVAQNWSIPSLLKLLTCDSEESREDAADELRVASFDRHLQDAIALQGGITTLTRILEDGTETNENVIAQVAAVFVTLSTHPAAQTESMQQGRSRFLVRLAKHGPDDVKIAAVNALLSTLPYLYLGDVETAYNETLPAAADLLCNGTDGVRDQVASWMQRQFFEGCGNLGTAQPGIILALLQVLKIGSDRAKVDAAKVLTALVGRGGHRKTILLGGGIPLLVPMLMDTSVQNEVLATLMLFANQYPDTLAQIASVGLPILQRIVEQGTPVDDADRKFISTAQMLCITLARDPQAAALMVQADMLPWWVRLSHEGSGETKRLAGRVVKYLSRVTVAQGPSDGPGASDSATLINPSLRREG
jgi:hypothetical protein